MKISKQKLVQVINEEVQRFLFEAKKMKISVKGKKKEVETEGAFGSGYDDYDYVRDSAPGPLSDYEKEREAERAAQNRRDREEESAKRDREYRQMDDYSRSSRSDE
jgi:hypothetical protein